ncbi:unnamed protein product [Prunus armeniaca]
MFTVVLIGSIVGFSGAALGSVGGVGGGGNACLDHWFDPKSSTAISKCQYDNVGAAANAHAGHQHRGCLQRHVRQLDGHSSTYHSLLSYSSKSFNEGHRNMEERDNDEEGSRKAVGIRVTFRFLRLNYCICEEERIYDVDGWLAAWKQVGTLENELRVLHTFLFTSNGEGPNVIAISSVAIGSISLIIGELGRRRSRVSLLKVYIVASSIGILLSIACVAIGNLTLEVFQNPSNWETKKFELLEATRTAIAFLVQIFTVSTTTSLISNMSPPKRAS